MLREREPTPTVAQAVLFDEELEWWTSLGLLRREQVDGHRAYYVTRAGQDMIDSARGVVEKMSGTNETKRAAKKEEKGA